MTSVLLWLTSDDPLPKNTDSSSDSETVLLHLLNQASYPENPIITTALYDKQFFKILELAYMKHLKPALLSFGRLESLDDLDLSSRVAEVDDEDIIPKGDSSKDLGILWNAAHGRYIKEICSQITQWSKNKLLLAPDLTTKKVIDELVPKIQYLQKWKLLFKNPILPDVPNPSPIFSVLFYTDLASSLGEVTN